MTKDKVKKSSSKKSSESGTKSSAPQGAQSSHSEDPAAAKARRRPRGFLKKLSSSSSSSSKSQHAKTASQNDISSKPSSSLSNELANSSDDLTFIPPQTSHTSATEPSLPKQSVGNSSDSTSVKNARPKGLSNSVQILNNVDVDHAPVTDSDGHAPVTDSDGHAPVTDSDGHVPVTDSDGHAPDSDGHVPVTDSDGHTSVFEYSDGHTSVVDSTGENNPPSSQRSLPESPGATDDNGKPNAAAARAMRSRKFSLSRSGRVKETKQRMAVATTFQGNDVQTEF